jgi:multidrug resistance efflux pump
MKRERRFQYGRLRVHVLPVLVWLAATAGVVGLFYHRSQRFEILGIVQGQVQEIAATCDGRLKSVPVRLFQEIRKGEILAVIDTVLEDENLQPQLATAAAEILHLKAQLDETRERLVAEAVNEKTNWVADKRRFSVDIENANKIVQSRLDTDPLATYELQKLQVRRRALAKKIEENQRLLARAEQDLKEAQQRSGEFALRQVQHPSVDKALEVINRAVRVQELRVEELLARRVPVELKSPIDGVVSQILRRPVRRTGEGVVRQMLRRSGEVVLAGDPIMTVSATRPSEIITYVGSEQRGQVLEGMAVEIIKESEPPQIASSRVTYLGPIMEVMPQQLWVAPDIPDWGRPMLIEIPPGMVLVPGETVGIRGF